MDEHGDKQDSAGERLRRRREAAGYSQMGLCRDSGVSQATLYRAEVGGVVSRRTAERLARVLGCEPRDLLNTSAEGSR